MADVTLTPQRVVRGCVFDIGFATDFPNPVRPPDGGYNIIGLATNGPDPIDVFRPASKRLASQVRSRLGQDLFERESEAIEVARKRAEAEGYVLKGPTAQARRRMKIEVETLRAAVDRNRTTWVYLEGKKVYQPNSKVTHPNSVEGLDIRLAALLTLPPSGEQAGSFNHLRGWKRVPARRSRTPPKKHPVDSRRTAFRPQSPKP